MSEQTEFVRHQPGGKVETIHRRNCPHAKRLKVSLPWNWAEGRDPNEWLRLEWFRACRVCCPDLQRGSDA